jgi:hypothetical protein
VKFMGTPGSPPATLSLQGTNGDAIPQGTVSAVFNVPAGYVLDGTASNNLTLTAPLTTSPIIPVSTTTTGQTLLVNFNKQDIANNVPTGSGVPLTISGIFTKGGVQAMYTATATVTVQK